MTGSGVRARASPGSAIPATIDAVATMKGFIGGPPKIGHLTLSLSSHEVKSRTSRSRSGYPNPCLRSVVLESHAPPSNQGGTTPGRLRLSYLRAREGGWRGGYGSLWSRSPPRLNQITG